jgi:hypothetical protein
VRRGGVDEWGRRFVMSNKNPREEAIEHEEKAKQKEEDELQEEEERRLE